MNYKPNELNSHASSRSRGVYITYMYIELDTDSQNRANVGINSSIKLTRLRAELTTFAFLSFSE